MVFIFSLQELIDVILMSLIVGFIFKDFLIVPKAHRTYEPYDPLKAYKQQHRGVLGYLTNNLWFAIAITAPAIILHELFHKFFAMSLGYFATFNAAYSWLGIGVVLKLIGLPLFFVPAYVSISGGVPPLQHSLIAFAGPLANLVIYLSVVAYMRWGKPKKHHLPFLVLTRRINGFLFILNMIPIPGFDGAKVFSGLFTGLF